MALPRELTKKEKDNTKRVLELIPRCMTMSETPQGEAFWMNVYDQLIILLDFRLATEVDEDDDAPAPPVGVAVPQYANWANIPMEHLNVNHQNHLGQGLAQFQAQFAQQVAHNNALHTLYGVGAGTAVQAPGAVVWDNQGDPWVAD